MTPQDATTPTHAALPPERVPLTSTDEPVRDAVSDRSVTPALPDRYRRTVLTNYLHSAALILVAIGVTPVLVRSLGKTEFGIWALVGTLALYLELLEFGFAGATVRKIAEFDAVARREQLRRAVATSFWLLTIPGLIALALGVAVAFLFPVIFDVPASLEAAATILVLLVTFDLALSIPADTFGGVLIGLQRYDLLNATLIATVLAQAAAWVVILALGGGLVALGIATISISLAGQLARFVIARRLVPEIRLSRRHFDRKLVRPLATLSVWYSIEEISWVVRSRADVIIVGVIAGVPAAAIYAVGQKLALAGTSLVAPVADGFFPLSSALAAKGDTARLRGAIVTGTRISLAIALPLAITIGVLAVPALDAWVGAGFEEAGTVVVLLVANAALKALPSVGIRMLMGIGTFRTPSIAFAFEAVLSVSLSVALGLRYGIVGVALAAVIATVAVHICFAVPYIAREFGLSLVRWSASLARAHAAPAIATGLLGWLFLELDVSGLGPVAAAGACMMIAYLALLAVTGMSAAERRSALRFAFGRRRT